MKTKILVLFLALCSMNSWANPIPKSAALQNARSFLSSKKTTGMLKAASTKDRELSEVAIADGFYAFNIADNGGYVIASASDKTQAILGYSDYGSLDPDNMPEPLRDWLSSLNHIIGLIESNTAQEKNITKHNVPETETKTAIEPMVQSKWNQGDPYNLSTPSYVSNGVTYSHSATGCVATAMAQIMYYWKWPQAATTTIPSYTYNWSGNSRTMPELPAVVFQWDKMTDTYSSSSTTEAKNAVAELMLYVGCAVKMGYGASSGAGVTNTLGAFKNYFDYNPDLYYAYQTNYTYEEWENLFYNELSAGRPLLMNADNYERTGGHEFVCDGYKDGLYHMNWGWGGWDDGYFVLTVMAPDSQGIGGSSDANGYSMGQGIVVNVHPNDGTVDKETVRLSISDMTCYSSSVKRSSDGTFSSSIVSTLHNTLLHSYDIAHAYRLFDADGNIVLDEISADTANYQPNSNYRKTATFTIPASVADGTYYLKGISRQKDSTEWHADFNADDNYAVLTIGNDTMGLSIYPAQGFGLVVNSLTFNGTSVSGEWQKVVFNITNNGADFYGETYMYVDGVRSSGNMISINSGETKDITYKFKVSTLGSHKFVLSRQASDTYGVFYSTDKILNATCYWDASGEVHELEIPDNTSIAATSDMLAIYLPGEKPKTISLGDEYNANLVIYFDEGASVSSRVLNIYRKKISNIVFGETADEAKFVDNVPAYVPTPFTAKTVSFTRTSMPYWSTLVVPFAIQKVSVDGTDIDWFHSADDTGKSLLIKAVSGRRGSSVYLNKYIDTPEANMPYFIGTKGTVNGTDFDIFGKDVTFSATNVLIESTDSLKHDDGEVYLVGTYNTNTLTDAYVLDAEGLNFVKQTTAGVPFHAYLGSTSTGYDAYKIKFKDGEYALGITNIENTDENNVKDVYDLNGIKVGTSDNLNELPHGFYIVGGKKVVK